jgi:hypothetical protein
MTAETASTAQFNRSRESKFVKNSLAIALQLFC